MAQGLQFKENLTLISGGYPGEGLGSNGVHQDWTDTTGTSGTSTVTYYYHDSALLSDANSTRVDLTITDIWEATPQPGNVYRIKVTCVINSITRTRIGNPTAYSTRIHVKQSAGGGDIWVSPSCDDSTTTHTIATNIQVGTYYFDLPPESTGSTRGTVYYRSNACGHDGDVPPSIYVDEFWMGINFRNLLPKNYIPGKTWNGSDWLSHNRATNGHAKQYNGSAWGGDMKTTDGGTGTGDPPTIYNSGFKNMRKIGQE